MAITFDGRFANGATFATYNRIDLEPGSADIPGIADGRPGVYEYASDPTGAGGRCAKLTTTFNSPGRTELRPFDVDETALPAEIWYAWWVLFPDDWSKDSSQSVDVATNLVGGSRTIIGQLHDTADVGDTTHFPLFQLYALGGWLTLATTYDTAVTTTQRAPNLRVLGNWPLMTGQWYEFVYHTNISLTGSGFINFYINRRLRYSITGTPNGYNDVGGVFFKAGAYGYYGSNSPAKRTLYSRGVVVGDAASSYLEVTGNSVLQRASARSAL